MPTRIFPSTYQPPAVPSLDELLAKVQMQTAMQAPTLAYPQEGAMDGLSSMLRPYQGAGPLGMSQGPGFYQMAGMGTNPLDILGGMGGAPAPSLGGMSPAAGGGAPVPYTGPPDPNVNQWEAAYPTTGKIPLNEMRRVPMNTGALVERYDQAKPWEDVNTRMPNAERDYMMPEAAQAYRAMMRDAAEEGVPLVFGQSYRSYPEQVQIAAEKGIYGQGGLAAVPGTSNHGLGLALDLNLSASPGQREWLLQNGPKYGFHFPMADEPWHIEYMGGFEGWSPDFKPKFRPGPGSSTTGSGGPPASSAGSRSTGRAPRRKAPSTGNPHVDRLIREGY